MRKRIKEINVKQNAFISTYTMNIYKYKRNRTTFKWFKRFFLVVFMFNSFIRSVLFFIYFKYKQQLNQKTKKVILKGHLACLLKQKNKIKKNMGFIFLWFYV